MPPKILIPLAVLSLASCNEYYTPPSTSLPMTGGSSGAVQDHPHARPTVRFPARVAIARIEPAYDSFRLVSGGGSENPEHAAKVTALPGVRGMVPLGRVALATRVNSYRELDREALKLGADLLAVYRIETERRSSDAFEPLSILSLGFAPTVSNQTTTVATLIVRDARTGYIYGVLEERAESKGVTMAMDISSAQRRAAKRTEKEAMDRLMERLPGFWNGVLAKGK